MKKYAARAAALAVTIVVMAGCGPKATDSTLRDSFAQQLGTNKFIKDFQRNGDEMTFTAPGAEGGTARWRVHIDHTSIEQTESEQHPYKGFVMSSWYSDNKLVKPRARESNLPLELISNGVAQECFAFWEKQGKRWNWEE